MVVTSIINHRITHTQVETVVFLP